VDFGLYARVLWRFRVIVLLGLLLASSLAALSAVKVGADGVSYRQDQLFAAKTRLLVTQSGFPEGRLYGQTPTQAADPKAAVVDPGRFNNLAVLYAELATSDPVRLLMLRDGPLRGKVIANPVVGGGEFKIQLPMIDVTAVATSPERAVRLAQRSANALTSFVRDQQQASKVPVDDRAVIQTVVRPGQVLLVQPRSKTMPIVVFAAVMFVTVGLVFILENLRPRRRDPDVSAAASQEDAMPPRRRSA
jgi:hypothetical protein